MSNNSARLTGHVPSLSDPRQRYEVHEQDGALFCNCQAFASWKKRGLPCWHLRVWKSAQGAIVRCTHLTKLDQDFGICRDCLLAVIAAMAGKIKRDYVLRADAKASKAAAIEKLRARAQATKARQKARKSRKKSSG